jgi:hypothetical protein
MSQATQRPRFIRGLTPAEKAVAAEVFGAGLNTDRVRIMAIPQWRRAFVAGPGLMVWPSATIRPDFAAPGVPLRVQGVFVHELTHVWQAQNGVWLILAKLRAGDGPGAYRYDIDGTPFAAMNIEQQAMLVEHAFLSARGAPAPHAAERYATLSPAWRRG